MGCGCKDKGKKPGTIRFLAKTGEPLKAASRIQAMRRSLCSMCPEYILDENGDPTIEKLYGQVGEDYYCGDPNDPRTDEDQRRFGCGCNVNERTQHEAAVCPRGRWGPGKRIGAEIIAFFTKPDGETDPHLYDFIGPARSGRDGLIDCTGIGDTLVQGVAAQAIWEKKRAEGINVRFVSVTHRMKWAELATAGKMEIADFSDPNRRRAQYIVHSAPIRAVEIDATCQLRGICRQELIALEHHTPPAKTRSWDVKIPAAAFDVAEEFLSHPLREQRPIIALSPWTNASVRQWPIRHWGQLSDLLKQKGFAVCLLDSPKTKGRAVPSDAFPFPKFRSADPYEVAAVVSKVHLVIGNDSGMPHLGGFVGTPAIAVCGPTNGKVAFGGWPSVRPVQSPGKCSGCLWFQDSGWNAWCSFGCEALSDLKPPVVVEHAIEIINQNFREGAA